MKSVAGYTVARGVGSLAKASYLKVALVALASIATGCGDDGPHTDPGSQCTRDAERIEAGEACVSDEHCPCGAHCTLGECVAECMDDGECGDDERCDLFGYCRDEGDLSRIPVFEPSREGRLVVSPSSVQIYDEASERDVQLAALDLDLGEVRALADEGMEVSCDGGGAYQTECRIDGVTVGAGASLRIRLTSPLGGSDVRVLRVFAGTQRELVTVASATGDLGTDRLITPDLRGALGGPLAGAYRGRARLLGTAITDDPTDPGSRTSVVANELEISATVHAAGDTGPAVLVLDDPSGFLRGDSEWVGDLQVDGDGESGTLDFPSVLANDTDAIWGMPIQELIDAPAADVVVSDVGARSLAFSLVTRRVGALEGRAIQTRWAVSLFRTGDVPSDATEPPVPADAVATLAPTRGANAEGWEAEFEAAMQGWVAASDFLGGSEFTVFETVLGDAANLVACEVPMTGDEVYAAVWISAMRGGLVAPVAASGQLSANADFTGEQLEAEIASASPNPLIAFLADVLFREWLGPPDDRETYSSTTLRLTAPADGEALACAFSTADTMLKRFDDSVSGSNGSWVQNLNTSVPVDVCAAMAANYGCTLVDSAPGDTSTLPFTAYSQSGTTDYETAEPDITIDVQRRCVFPAAPAPAVIASGCGELAACFDPLSEAPGPVGVAGESSRLGDTVDRPSGDLACAASPDRGLFLPADVNEGDLSQSAMLSACIADLDRLAAMPSATALGSLFDDSAECVDAARLIYAASLALEPTRLRAINPDLMTSPRDEELAARLLQRWVQLHGFIASQTLQGERLAEVIRRDDSSDPGLPPTTEDALDASLRGWDLLLHPRYLEPLLALDGAVVAAPDYRPSVAPDFVDPIVTNRDQSEGVSVAILDTLNSQLGLVAVLLERALGPQDLTALDPARRVLASVGRVRPVADALLARAEASGEMVSWANRHALAADQLDRGLTRVLDLMEALREGRNPFGIEDEDLPLYFQADTVGASRFTAISDFLLGDSLASPSSFAPAAVRDATEALTDARQAWTLYTDRRTQRRQSEAELDERLFELNQRFGGEVSSYCGAPSGLATVDILEGWEAAHGAVFSGENCFYNYDDPSCDFQLADWASQLDLGDVLMQYCVLSELSDRLGPLPALDDPQVGAVAGNFAACATDSEIRDCAGSSGQCLKCGSLPEVPLSPHGFASFRAGAPQPMVDAARATCTAQFPDASPQLPGIDTVDAPALDDANCYRGSLGEAVLTVRAAAQDVGIARSEYAEFQERYDIAMQGCIRLKAGNDALEDAQRAHDRTMTDLRIGKLVADVASNAAAGVKDCASATDIQSGAAGAVACGASAAEAVAESVSDGLQFAMDEAQQKHDALIMSLEADTAEDICFIDAEAELVGVRTAGLRIQRAISDLQVALYQTKELKGNAESAYADGLLALAATEGRAYAPMAHDYWLAERLQTYTRRFRNAKRITYLAVRAVEYEFQTSLPARELVLAAEVPDDLERALDMLWSTAATRRINGNAPTELKIVVSLKRNLLQLADQTERPAGWAALSDTERLRAIIFDPANEVWEDGVFVGRALPFELAPLESLGLGEAQGISVFAANSCAERLWSVNATLQGERERLFIGDDPSFVDIQLLKQNTFYSQWCDPDSWDSDYQLASVRPSRNLFADPGTGASTGSELGLGGEAQLYSRARMQAFFNVDRDEFSNDDYANGDSSELAARGLYGGYQILFPAGLLSSDGSTGLDLNAVDDILLRLDYVSVAR
ncbi:MAG: hypothetical protein JJ863_09800 [Deltaproteobacteria bacterium]|nr:hypothetical protein [Deltaproteobacteria bacterium]